MAIYHLSLKNGKVGNGKTHAEYIMREGKYAGSKKAEELVLNYKMRSGSYNAAQEGDLENRINAMQKIMNSAQPEIKPLTDFTVNICSKQRQNDDYLSW